MCSESQAPRGHQGKWDTTTGLRTTVKPLEAANCAIEGPFAASPTPWTARKKAMSGVGAAVRTFSRIGWPGDTYGKMRDSSQIPRTQLAPFHDMSPLVPSLFCTAFSRPLYQLPIKFMRLCPQATCAVCRAEHRSTAATSRRVRCAVGKYRVTLYKRSLSRSYLYYCWA